MNIFNPKTLISEKEASTETHRPRPLKFQKVICTIATNMLNKKFEIKFFDAISSDKSQIL